MSKQSQDPISDIKEYVGDIIDSPEAKTIQELSRACGLSETATLRFARDMVTNGTWKKGKQKRMGRFIPVYIKVK